MQMEPLDAAHEVVALTGREAPDAVGVEVTHLLEAKPRSVSPFCTRYLDDIVKAAEEGRGADPSAPSAASRSFSRGSST
jgi:hypothetical protein